MSQIAILSDSHDNIPSLLAALAGVRSSGADLLLHCGDLCAPFMVKHLAEGFAGPIHIVFGNNDGDGRLLHTVASQFGHVFLHDVYHEGEHGGRRYALIHYPEPARRIAQSGQFDIVCYGHNHLQNWEQVGEGFLINPGEVFGLLHGAPTWGLYDCDNHTFKFRSIRIENSG